MRTQENGLWKWLQKARHQIHDASLLHWHRIENSCDKGTPDVEGCYIGRSFVLELKSVPRHKHGNVITELTEHQAMFLDARCNAGGNAWVLIQVGGEERYLIWGNYALGLQHPIKETRLRELSVKCTATPRDVLEAISTISFIGRQTKPMSDTHGLEVTRFVKPGQTIRIMQDGCLIAEIVHVVMSASGHTLKEHQDSDATRQNLIASGFVEEEL